ncbi:MAG: GIY-YIG nuclease family protein [Candidatus Bathyarchaeota archaeon]|nr:GIY-YIG nuclease family protein [Candidatus Bathyarchaeota archaeon]
MWATPEDIVGEDRTIDKYELVRGFLNAEHETSLRNRDELASWLGRFVRDKKNRIGVYCIYDRKKNEVLYVGESVRLEKRIREQLIGREERESGLLRFTRLIYGVLRREKDMKEKGYRKSSLEGKKELNDFYLNTIFKPNNILRVCFTMDEMRALVLENTLIKHFKEKGQCRYNKPFR